MKDTWLFWSSGKDSLWALRKLRTGKEYRVTTLVTTMNQEFDRVAMHSVRRRLVEMQAEAVQLPLRLISLPWPCSNQRYEEILIGELLKAVEAGVKAVAFGDLFLQDIRDYRIRQLAGTSLEPVFPLWKAPTRTLAEEMIRSGMKARITCVDPRLLDASFAGRRFDRELLADLPESVDPCGENGEFHTFVYDGPGFRSPLRIEVGRVCRRDGFVFADIAGTFKKQ